MTGFFLLLLVLSEIGLTVYCFVKKQPSRLVARILWLVQAAAICLYFLLSPHHSTFQWSGLLLMMVIHLVLGVWGVIRFTRKKDEKPFRKGGVIVRAVLRCAMWLFVMIPMLLFPPYRELKTTGSYTVANKSYTWVDESRVETLDDSGDNRHVTVTFYYPAELDENTKCPLIFFSHGAFGFEKSNYSSYAELVSNGYIVCSISHTYHAFFTKETDGTVKTVNMDFMQEAIDATNGKYSIEDEYALTSKWMSVRLGDANFVLDTVIKNCAQGSDSFFRRIDLEHMGWYGHSMGGATAVEMGRQREEIDAVVVLDGTFIGSYTGVENGHYVFNTDVYTKPLLSVMAIDHYENHKDVPTEDDAHVYVNYYITNHAAIGKEAVIDGTGHMNLTDLPMFSPTLAKMLGTGDRDSREVLEITNDMVREWFDAYVKGDGSVTPDIKSLY